MQELLFLNRNEIVIQANGEVYQDTKDNFLLDYGKVIPQMSVNQIMQGDEGNKVVTELQDISVIDYNRDVKSCWLNGHAFQEYPNEVCEDIMNSIDTLLANKKEREYVEPTLEELKVAKVAEMKAERDRIQEEPIDYNGKSFDYNKESLQKLNEAKDCLEGTTDKQIWICADNSLTFLTYDDIMTIKRLGKDRSNDVHIQYAKLKYIIEQLETAEEVQAITFETDTSAIVLEV